MFMGLGCCFYETSRSQFLGFDSRLAHHCFHRGFYSELTLWTIVPMKPKASSSLAAPIQVKRGSVTVKIYKGANRVSGISYDQFTVVYYDGVQRKKKTFATLGEARREANLTATVRPI